MGGMCETVKESIQGQYVRWGGELQLCRGTILQDTKAAYKSLAERLKHSDWRNKDENFELAIDAIEYALTNDFDGVSKGAEKLLYDAIEILKKNIRRN